MKNIKLLTIIPNMKDGTSLYRGIGPLARMQRDGLQLVMAGSVDWSVMAMSDICFMQRPFKKDHLAIAEMAVLNGLPLWLDYDDDLFSVPGDNPTSEMYNNPEIQKCMATMIGMADVITCSTPHLAHVIGNIKKGHQPGQIRVVPNAFNQHPFGFSHRDKIPDCKKTIFWRGSHTHVRDVLCYVPELSQLDKELNEHKEGDWKFKFLGMNPWMLEGAIHEKNIQFVHPADPINFMWDINMRHRPQIMMVPLYPNEFNLSKSNIAWIEGTWAGAAIVAPDWPEWRKPGVTVYDPLTPGSMAAALKELTHSAEFCKNLSDMSWNYIKEELTIEKINKLRWQVIEDLLA